MYNDFIVNNMAQPLLQNGVLKFCSLCTEVTPVYKSEPRHKEVIKLEEKHYFMSCSQCFVSYSRLFIERITYGLALVLIDVIEDHNL